MRVRVKLGWKLFPRDRGENNIYIYIYVKPPVPRRGPQGLLVISANSSPWKLADKVTIQWPISPSCQWPFRHVAPHYFLGGGGCIFFGDARGYGRYLGDIGVNKKIGWQTKSCWKMHHFWALAIFLGRKGLLVFWSFSCPSKSYSLPKRSVFKWKEQGKEDNIRQSFSFLEPLCKTARCARFIKKSGSVFEWLGIDIPGQIIVGQLIIFPKPEIISIFGRDSLTNVPTSNDLEMMDRNTNPHLQQSSTRWSTYVMPWNIY